ncbi:hypothetical protein HPP92_027758 [Vanilla planifolia]|uniref:Uncharacterized protein n=1 Tax=Vanilla planifolia TaxID=51239 RepID=A0A835P7U5_VANPL|nr:hypothetical protein HPP92_027758 [Vanilla planifolia]
MGASRGKSQKNIAKNDYTKPSPKLLVEAPLKGPSCIMTIKVHAPLLSKLVDIFVVYHKFLRV